MSIASEPELLKKKCCSSPPVSFDSFAASCTTGGRRRPEERVVERQLEHLLVRGARELFAPVADVDAPQPRHAVEQRATFRIVDAAAFGARDDAAAAELLHEAVVLLRRQMMREVEPPQGFEGDVLGRRARGRDVVTRPGRSARAVDEGVDHLGGRMTSLLGLRVGVGGGRAR